MDSEFMFVFIFQNKDQIYKAKLTESKKYYRVTYEDKSHAKNDVDVLFSIDSVAELISNGEWVKV